VQAAPGEDRGVSDADAFDLFEVEETLAVRERVKGSD
jgi:hypothetical protein